MHASSPAPRDATDVSVQGSAAAPEQPAAAPPGDDADEWIGYESFHPLTWLPAPGAPLPVAE